MLGDLKESAEVAREEVVALMLTLNECCCVLPVQD